MPHRAPVSVAEPAPDDKPTTPQRSLYYLRRMLWPLAIQAVQRHEDAGRVRYRLIIDGGQVIELGTATEVFSQTTARKRIFAETGQVIERKRPREWDDICRELAAVAEVVA